MIYQASPETIQRAAQALANGELVAFPTETVYGLGADATSDLAAAAIFEAKARPRLNPLIVHVPDLEAAARYGVIEGPALALARAFWPGPLTLVVRRRQPSPLSALVSAGLDTIALRVPSHPVAQALLRQSTVPVAAPSANRSGSLSPTLAAHVAMGLRAPLPLILDGGSSGVGLESTIIGFRSGGRPVLLRAGGIERGEIEALAGPLHSPGLSARAGESVSAPGQYARHYAPGTPLRLNATQVASDEGLLAFGPDPLAGAKVTRNLSEAESLREAAANLFRHLHALDGQELKAIAVMAIPEAGLGEAINDRLRRAAVPAHTTAKPHRTG